MANNLHLQCSPSRVQYNVFLTAACLRINCCFLLTAFTSLAVNLRQRNASAVLCVIYCWIQRDKHFNNSESHSFSGNSHVLQTPKYNGIESAQTVKPNVKTAVERACVWKTMMSAVLIIASANIQNPVVFHWSHCYFCFICAQNCSPHVHPKHLRDSDSLCCVVNVKILEVKHMLSTWSALMSRVQRGVSLPGFPSLTVFLRMIICCRAVLLKCTWHLHAFSIAVL